MHSPTPSFTEEQILFLLQRVDIFYFLKHSCSYITQFIRSGRLFKMAIVVMSQPGFWSDSMHSRVLILTGSL